MITDKEIQKIFDWADENKVIGKRWKNAKWGINLSDDEISSVKRGIPRDKATLLQITHLNLAKAKLSDIPNELYKLTKLQDLDISNNEILVLSQDIGNLHNLEYLNLSGNYIDYESLTIPKEIKKLKNLKYLNLIDLDNIPLEIWMLTKLETLRIAGDYESLIEIPKEIGKLINLNQLELNYLSNKKLPKEIEKLSNLESLELTYCEEIKEFPIEIGHLKNLKHLELNELINIEQLPKEIGKLNNLETLIINDCTKLQSIPKEIGNLLRLRKLDISDNDSLKELPKEIANLTQLRELNFRWTNIKKLPDEFSNLINLEKLNGEPYIRIKNEAIKEQTQNKTTLNKNIFLIDKLANLTFPHKNILLKGVPGTGKSRAIENIINNKLELENYKENVLRINIHSASSNADLMQGIGISSSDGKIEYKEKQGLILDIIQRATFKPNQPFVLILEEIQENSLNELIGDLIYLIEEDKRAKNIVADDEGYAYQELVEKIIEDDPSTDYVEIPYLVNDSTEYRKMIMPNNFYIFCTSNYRDDKKVIEDNLLRRFEVLEVYPREGVAHEYCRDFFKALNENILTVLKDEIHPDRFLIGHAIWKDVSDKLKFYRAFLKVVVEFKDIKEVEFDEFKKIIKELPMLEELDLSSYKALIENLQNKAGYDFLD